MNDLYTLVRPNIRELKPYSSARDEFHGSSGIFLDANENPYGRYNRYPDPYHGKIRDRLSQIRGFDRSGIFIGNGSDEIIDLTFRIFCEPGKDKALTFSPTYGMYSVAAGVNDVTLVTADLDGDFNLDINLIGPVIKDERIKLVILCSPNNPTGNTIGNYRYLIDNFKGIILVDEAYIDFSPAESMIRLIKEHPNIIVMQTLSKSYGLAGARIGIAYADSSVTDLFYRVKPPYNVSTPDQEAALTALDNNDRIMSRVEEIKRERAFMFNELSGFSFVRKVWPSDANFLLVRVNDPSALYATLAENGIVVRNRDSAVPGALRITIGTPAENRRLLSVLSRLDGGTSAETITPDNMAAEKARFSAVTRSTSETTVNVILDLDERGKSEINTGIGFLDHMLYQLARHGGFRLEISAAGDLEVDEHHTIEDVALTLGEAFNSALGNRKGIERYGFMVPMDDSLARVAVDFGGRPYLVWDVTFRAERTGQINNDLFFHFFRSFSEAARCNINVKAEGTDDHHKIEAVFKAFARAVKMAVHRDGTTELPSTKEMI